MHYIIEDPAIIIILSIFIILIISFIIIFIIYYQKKQVANLFKIKTMQHEFENNLLQSQIETQEETFLVLGNELHDNVGQLLNSAKLLIGVTQRTLSEVPETLAAANDTIAAAIVELRSLSKSLNKEWLQQFNFIENSELEIKRINSAQILQIQFSHPDKLPLKSDEQIILFRIVQEALQNAIKHSHAKNIVIKIWEEQTNLLLLIKDDGSGFKAKEKQLSGVGLINMQNRTKLLGGNIQWQSSKTGTTITIQLPIKPIE